MKKARIGIPRALLYYSFCELWKEIFNESGLDVISSPETTEEILKNGIRKSVGDICLPVKTFLGHVFSLKDSVDYLFIPRYVSIEEDAYMCPKLIGLPDMVRASFSNIPEIISPVYNVKNDRHMAVILFSREISKKLSIAPRTIEKCLLKCSNFTDNNRNKILSSGISKEAVNIGLTGRPYLLFDRYLNKNIFKHLKDSGANPVYITPTADDIREAMTIIPKWVYWSMGKEVVSSAHVFFKDDNIHGVINLSSAACGPDSFTSDLIRKRLNPFNKPYMSITVDEHSSDVGIQTRLEAFVDMIIKVKS